MSLSSVNKLNMAETVSSQMMFGKSTENASQQISERYNHNINNQISKPCDSQESSHQTSLKQQDRLYSQMNTQASTRNDLEQSFQAPTMTFTSRSSSLETSSSRQKLEEFNEKLRVVNKEVSEKRIGAARMSVEHALLFKLDWMEQMKIAEKVMNCCRDGREESLVMQSSEMEII